MISWIQLLRFSVLLAIVILSPGKVLCSELSTVQEKLDNANRLFSMSHYKDAIEEYQEIVSVEGLSPELLHNIGNCYLALGHDGYAILSYIRGLRLAPGDDDLRGSLLHLKKNIGLFEENHTLIEKTFGFLNLNQWATAALVLYAGLTLLMVANFFYPIKKGLKRSCVLLFTMLSLCGLGIYQQWGDWYGAVITSPDTKILLSPFESAAPQGLLTEGEIVFPQKEYGRYGYIKDKKGRAGWIDQKSYTLINTHHSIYFQDNAE